MNIELFVKNGKATVNNEDGGARVLISVNIDRILHEVEVRGKGETIGSLYINRNYKARWSGKENCPDTANI